MTAAQAAKNHEDKCDYLIITMRNIYINSNLELYTKFGGNNGRTKFTESLPWNISKMTKKTNQHESNHRLHDE